jgi:hypothetical protein
MKDTGSIATSGAAPGPRRPRRPRRWLLAGVTAAGCLLAGSVTAGAVLARHAADHRADRTAFAIPRGPLPPPARNALLPVTGALVGASVQPTEGSSDASAEAAITAFERMIGRTLAVDSHYISWQEPMPVALARWDLRGGRIPMISWGHVSSAQIVAGTYDRQIRAQARRLKSVRGPVLLRYFPEMNNSFFAKAAGSPSTYIAAWRHVYGIFRSVGATNVQWVWCPTAIGFTTGVAERFYPGEAYVNWIGADGYNWAPGLPGAAWRSFSAIFSGFYDWADRQRRPLLIGEFGSTEGSPGAKAAWFRQVGRQLRTQFPRIRAVVYFNSIHDNFGHEFNWTVNSSPSSLAAFRAVVNDPYFSARPTI